MKSALFSSVKRQLAAVVGSVLLLAAVAPVSAVLTSVLVLAPVAAHADELACIAIYPCDDDGYLLSDYSDPANPCYSYFLSQCPQGTPPAAVKQSSCDATLNDVSVKYEKRIAKLQKQLRLLRVSRSR